MTGSASRGDLACVVVPFGPHLWSELGPEWDRLTRATTVASAFTSTLWLESWLEIYGPRFEPSGLIWRDASGEAVGCALLAQGDVRVGPFLLRRAYLNASADIGALCEHNDLLVMPEHREAVTRDFVLRVREAGFDELVLVGVREDTAERIAKYWPESAWDGFLGESPYVSLEAVRAGARGYLGSLSSNTRWQIRRSIRLYEERFGPASVTVARSTSETSEAFDVLIGLHEAHWRSRGEPGAFVGDALRFHSRLIERGQGDEGRMRPLLATVRFGESTIAVLYVLEYEGRINFYQSGFDYDDDARLKPGMVSHALAIEHFLGEGAVEYDFLAGDPGPVRYKRSLSTDRRMLSFQQFPSRNARVSAIRGLRAARRMLDEGS